VTVGSLGDRVREQRVRLGLSQASLGAPDLSDSYISLIESGRRTPLPKVIETLARKLGCSTVYLQFGVCEKALAELTRQVSDAQNALDRGHAHDAAARFTRLAADPVLEVLPLLRRQVRRGLSLSLESSGLLDEAIAELERLARDVHGVDWEEWATLRVGLCRCHRERGDLDEAVAVAEDGLDCLGSQGRYGSDAWFRLGVALLDAYQSRGDGFTARRFADRLRHVLADAPGAPARMTAYTHVATAIAELGDHAAAARLVGLALAEAPDDARLERARLLLLLGRRGAAEKARALLRAHERRLVRRERGQVRGERHDRDLADCVTELACADLVLNRPRKAAEEARRALSLLGDTVGWTLVRALTVLGHACFRLGEHEDAVDALMRAARHLEELGHPRHAARLWYDVAEIHRHRSAADSMQSAAYRRALVLIGLAAGELSGVIRARALSG
jgi:tetratricopeptide (TPR) repeat protein